MTHMPVDIWSVSRSSEVPYTVFDVGGSHVEPCDVLHGSVCSHGSVFRHTHEQGTATNADDSPT